MIAERIDLVSKIEPFIKSPESPATNAFADFNIPDFYTSEKLSEVDTFLRDLSAEYSLQTPFFEYTDKTKSQPIFQVPVSRGLVLKSGPIGSYKANELATILMEQTSIYARRETMGRDFPLGDIQKERELLSAFIDGFDKDRIITCFMHSSAEGVKPIAGLTLVPNRSSRSLIASMESEMSCIPTFQSLNILLNPQKAAYYRSFQERDVVCITKYWSQEPNLLGSLRINDPTLPKKLIASIPISYTAYFMSKGLPVPPLAIFDTHKSGILNTTTRSFGANVAFRPGEIGATHSVMNTILKYHYGSAQWGGYLDLISVGEFNTGLFLSCAKEYLSQTNLNLPYPTVNDYIQYQKSIYTLS